MKWKKVTGYKKPDEIEIGKTTVYLRKSIKETTDNDGNEMWEYEETQLTHEQYKKHCSEMESPAVQDIMQALNELEAEQAFQGLNSDTNTETIMQAISDMQADIAMMGL
jgi:hypothetical protein